MKGWCRQQNKPCSMANENGYCQVTACCNTSKPTVDAEPVRQGHWIGYPECLKYENALDDSDIVCSVCGEAFDILDNDTERFAYCPHCGAKMDWEKENESNN